jgi:hypothetical protein
MRCWVLAAAVYVGLAGVALAQSGGAVNSGVNSDAGSMSGPNIDVVNGINANGTPRQQSPGASMTNGAGNSTMIPGVAGGSVGNAPAGTTHGTTTGTVKATQQP